MNTCPFVRLIVESLVLKLPPPAITTGEARCFCTVQPRLASLNPQASPIPVVSDDTTSSASPSDTKLTFHIDPSSISHKPSKTRKTAATTTAAGAAAARVILVLSVRAGGSKASMIGKVKIPIDLKVHETSVYRMGWTGVGKGRTLLHVVVRSEPDPRYVFQFGGEPECSPVVYQVQEGGGTGRGSGARLQPLFSCRFNADRRSSVSNGGLALDLPCKSRSMSNGCCRCFPVGGGGGRYLRMRREPRKGWTVTIHDLSGSPVAAASMITPFVPSPGSSSVSRSNPGAWLILRPTAGIPAAANAWKPWGRLEAWRERAPAGHTLGCRLELVVDPNVAAGAPVVESKLSVRKGGEFRIADDGKDRLGFVMVSTVEGEGKVSHPRVQLGEQHVRCMADAAVFVALSAAVDLSMDACRLFSKRLRKELCCGRRNHA